MHYKKTNWYRIRFYISNPDSPNYVFSHFGVLASAEYIETAVSIATAMIESDNNNYTFALIMNSETGEKLKSVESKQIHTICVEDC